MRYRGRLGCLLVAAYPVAEIAVAYAVAQVIGWWWVLVYVVVCIVLGLGLVRYALSTSGRSLGVALADLRGPEPPATPALEAARPRVPAPPARTLLIVPAGLLIAIPGFVTTVVGLVLWLPQVRTRIARRVERAARRMGGYA